MKRREVIQSLGLLSTHIMFPSILVGFVSSCRHPEQLEKTFIPQFFTNEEFQVLQEVIDIIIPPSKTLSASQVNTHHFLDNVFDKCMDEDQKIFIKTGFNQLVPLYRSAINKYDLISDIDAKAYSGDEESAYFRTIKQYTMVGFFTSQEGMTNASNYVKFPGDYKGEIEMDDNTLNYGKTNMRYYL